MYHSIKIGSDLGQIDAWKDTWNDWHLIPSARPQVSFPPVRTKYVDIPGMDGQLDLTEALTGGPLYGNRTGSWSFVIVNPYLTVTGVTGVSEIRWKADQDVTPNYHPTFDYDYHSLCSEIAAFLHGRSFKVILEDEPGYYYEGRLQLENPGTGKDYSQLSISYNLEPYKTVYIAEDHEDDWLWDPFNFLTDTLAPSGNSTKLVYGTKIL